MTETKFETSLVPEICGHSFYAPPLGPDSVIVDLGGSGAAFSLGVHQLTGCTCHVVEATSRNFSRIEETPKLHKYHYAIAGETAPVEISIAEERFHWGSIRPAPGQRIRETERVPGITLEDFLDEAAIARVDLLKVDIEGAEIDMFDATPDEMLGGIAQITVEFHDFADPALGGPVARVKERLRGLGFACLVLTRRFNGDVLFINTRRVNLPRLRRWRFATTLKFGRGLGRLMDRRFRSGA